MLILSFSRRNKNNQALRSLNKSTGAFTTCETTNRDKYFFDDVACSQLSLRIFTFIINKLSLILDLTDRYLPSIGVQNNLNTKTKLIILE